MNKSKSDLIQIIEQQQKQIDKYKNKLTDVVVAHKGLIKEKNAIESSLLALMQNKEASDIKKDEGSNEKEETLSEASESTEASGSSDANTQHLEKQLSSLMNSLATLSAEKSRLEASFQSDKKQLRLEKESIEKKCQQMQEKLKEMSSEMDELKSKLITERHVRDKEQSDHLVMIRELQHIVAVERSAKEHFEHLLEEAKVTSVKESSLVEHFESKIRKLTEDLAKTTKQLELSERKVNDNLSVFKKLKDEIISLKLEQQSALVEEKDRARVVEDQSKRISAASEERVRMLEDRLAELSETVGVYERLRQQDQISIQKLKEYIAQCDVTQFSKETIDETDLDNLVSRLHEIKNKILVINEKSDKPLDLHILFNEELPHSVDHSSCKEDYNKLKKEYDHYRQQVPLVNNLTSQTKSNKQVESLQNHVKHLQDRLRHVTECAEETEKEYETEIEHLKKTLKSEKDRFRETLSAAEADFRGRLSLLEQQLQKQRERSLAMLEEKEQEIHSLQSTFQMFLPAHRSSSDDGMASADDIVNKLQVNPGKDGPHILHYANELARRDVEIANLRKSKHLVESTLRDLQKAAVNDNEKHLRERQTLREEIARLERCKSREGANLEYLKNVVLSFLTSTDASSKRHMLNAIAAVLKFSENEVDKVTKHSTNSWWTRHSIKS